MILIKTLKNATVLLVFMLSVITINAYSINTTPQDTISIAPAGVIYEDEIYPEDLTLSQRIDNAFRPIVEVLGDFLFWDPFETVGLHDPVI